MTTANGVRGQLRPSSIRFLASAVVTQTCLMGSVQGAELTAGVPSVATPQATQFGEVTVVTKGTIAYGTIIRADDRDSELVPHGSGVVVVNGKARAAPTMTTAN
jgi:hypothetical protein